MSDSMTATVVLHVGAMKTGTTFIQAVMRTNRAALAERGVLWPGHSWADQVRAVNDVKSRRVGVPSSDGRRMGPPRSRDRLLGRPPCRREHGGAGRLYAANH